MQALRWILYFYFVFMVVASNGSNQDDCLKGAKESPIGQVLENQIEIDNKTNPGVKPAPLPNPKKQKLRGRRFMFIEEDYM